MRISNHVINLLLPVILIVVSCQSTPRVPVVMGTIKVPQHGDLNGLVAINPRTGYAYVAGYEYVTIVKETEIVGKILTGGKNPSSIAVDEASDRVYVVNWSSDNVTVIQGTEQAGVAPTIGRLPASVTIEPQSQFAYVVSGQRQVPLGEDPVEGNILILSGTKVIDNLKLGRASLTHVVADPVGGYVYVGSARGVVVVIKQLKEVARYIVGQTPDNPPLPVESMDVNPRTGEVYVLTSIDVSRFKDGRLLDSIKWGRAKPWSKLRVHPITGDVYVTWGSQAQSGGRVLVLREMKEIENIAVGGGAAAMAIDPLTGNVYVASFEEDTVTVINGTKALATIKVGWYPYGIGVNPVNGWVYVSNINDGTVTVLGYPQESQERVKTPSTTKTLMPSKPYP